MAITIEPDKSLNILGTSFCGKIASENGEISLSQADLASFFGTPKRLDDNRSQWAIKITIANKEDREIKTHDAKSKLQRRTNQLNHRIIKTVTTLFRSFIENFYQNTGNK